jgi:FO synthase
VPDIEVLSQWLRDTAPGAPGARASTAALRREAAALRDAGHGARITYSRKVFIPLTRLCRDTCRYCTFATVPRALPAPFLAPDEVLAIARAGLEAGCDEALFTLGDQPEARWPQAREWLARAGYPDTFAYLEAMCERVLRETGLLPHVNAGVMDAGRIARLRRVSVSQGLMLESVAERLCEPGGPHHGCPDKHPAARLAMLEAAGEQRVPFTSGLLIGIGETREERLATLLALQASHARHGHLQEVIVQNFRAKPGTAMHDAPDPGVDELAWTIALARLVFGPDMNIQAPPNLSPGEAGTLIAAGLNDWGGISPVTPDHVNPEAPWPQVASLRAQTAAAGHRLVERLAVYPAWALEASRWQHPQVQPALLARMDGEGLARTDAWHPGRDLPLPPPRPTAGTPHLVGALATESRSRDRLLARIVAGSPPPIEAIASLLACRDEAVQDVLDAADELRRARVGEPVSFVVNRNINYTNVCSYGCRFCAFSKGRLGAQLRGPAYDLDESEIARRSAEAWARGATEVCLQGGIHPDYTGETYLRILRTVREAAPGLHVHAFSPLEVTHGATTLGLSIPVFLERLREAGLGTLPGTAAEILDDEVRAVLCPDKLSTEAWLQVMADAHRVGLRSTATMMFGHVDQPRHWATHLVRIRDLQLATGGFTEFVPLPFVHMEAPIFLRGRARPGPTWREVQLAHAVARLALAPAIDNVQVSWVKLGEAGAAALLAAGANDLGGTLMNESISRAAGNEHGQELPPARMQAIAARAGRPARPRTTLYADAPAERVATALAAAPLAAVVQTPLRARRVPRAPLAPTDDLVNA